MAISPISFFTPATPAGAADLLQTLTSPSLLTALTGADRSTLVSFGVQFARLLAAVGPLPLSTPLAESTAEQGVFDNLLDVTLLRQFTLQAQIRELLLADPVLGETDATFLFPGAETSNGVFFRQGADGQLFLQLRLAGLGFDIQLEPQVIASSVIAQRFQVGLGAGIP